MVSRINHRVCVCGGGGGGEEVRTLLQLGNFALGPDATLNTEIHNNWVRIKLLIKTSTLANSTVCQSK